MAPRHLPHLAYNWLSGVGAVLASVAFLTSVVFLLVGIFYAGLSSPYIGILTYIVGPGLVLFGLVLIPIGMWLKSRALKQGRVEEGPHWPRIDFNQPRTRRGAAVFAAGVALYVVASAVGSFEAYHYTESVAFCGKLCHTVMEPQYVAHQHYAHAVVSCTDCHVGPGVGWYARSKVRGLSRVYEIATTTYPRPIPIPISDLRPEELQCHQCHWPENFFGGRHMVFPNYRYDTANTPHPVGMIIHTGGGDPAVGQTGGIHWSMYIGHKIEYIARDPKRQDIPWVRATNKKTGEVTVYQDETNPLSEEEIASATPRTLDCIDCHNICAHLLATPDQAIDTALLIGEIDPALPGVKRAAVSAMAASYESKDAAMTGIDDSIRQSFQKQGGDVAVKMKDQIDQAVKATQGRYSQNVFPYMKADWKSYPNNLIHLYYKACFRCHLGNHKSKDGKTISHDCTVCHAIISQGSGPQAEMAKTTAGLAFKHPVDIGGTWQVMACSTCHTGAGVGGPGGAPAAQAAPPQAAAPAKPAPTAALSAEEKAKAKKVYDTVCATCHGDDGKGNPAIRVAMPTMPDLSDPKWLASHSDHEMEDVIENGKGTMPPAKAQLVGITAGQMVAYVKTLASSPSAKPEAKKPSEKKPTEKKPTEKKPTEKKPETKMSEAAKPLPSVTLSAEEKAKAKKVYAAACTSCHGDDGKGNAAIRVAMPKLPDLSDPKWLASQSDQEMADAIENGKGTMPPAKAQLDGVTAKQMVAYTKTFAASASGPSPKSKSNSP